MLVRRDEAIDFVEEQGRIDDTGEESEEKKVTQIAIVKNNRLEFDLDKLKFEGIKLTPSMGYILIKHLRELKNMIDDA
jgi:hypothetical protein